MRAPRNSVLSQVVAVAWVRGYVDHSIVRAIAQCDNSAVGPRVSGAIKGGHLVELPGHKPKRWGLTPDRLEVISALPDQLHFQTLAEKTAQRVERIARIQAAEREERVAKRRAALARAATEEREARQAARVAARAGAKAARQTAIAKAKREPVPGQRPPMLPGSKLVVPGPAGAAPGVVVRDQVEQLAQQPVQDPKGLLAPADGPYIRPGARAHQAVQSRRGDALVAHRPPLSQP